MEWTGPGAAQCSTLGRHVKPLCVRVSAAADGHPTGGRARIWAACRRTFGAARQAQGILAASYSTQKERVNGTNVRAIRPYPRHSRARAPMAPATRDHGYSSTPPPQARTETHYLSQPPPRSRRAILAVLVLRRRVFQARGRVHPGDPRVLVILQSCLGARSQLTQVTDGRIQSKVPFSGWTSVRI